MKKYFLLLPFLWVVSACNGASHEPSNIETGKSLYGVHCASCHGASGDGQGTASAYLFPKPRDLTSGIFKYRTTRGPIPSDVDILQTMKKGIPGSSMPGWDLLGMKEWQSILAYVKLFSPRFAKEKPGDRFETPAEAASSPESVQKGALLFAKSGCAACHGGDAKGDGPASQHLRDAWGDRILPRDLRHGTLKWGNTPKDIYRTVAMGVPGTPMPGYEQSFTPDEIWSLVHYLKSIQRVIPQGYDPSDPRRLFLTVNRIQGELPLNPADPAWGEAKFLPVYLKPLWYEPEGTEWLDAKALTNGSEMAVMVSWVDDQMNNTPQQMDAVAIQFPKNSVADPAQLPYIGMGSEEGEVNIWHWKADEFLASDAAGINALSHQRKSDDGLQGEALYADGKWTVVFKRPIHLLDAHDSPLAVAGYLAFAVWDGDLPKHAGPEGFSDWLAFELAD